MVCSPLGSRLQIDYLTSRQGCQLGEKLAQGGLDEVMGTDSRADGTQRFRAVRSFHLRQIWWSPIPGLSSGTLQW